jgi:hypothetical protein
LKNDFLHWLFTRIKKSIVLLLDIRSVYHKNFITFLFFVLLSAIFWFFRSLSLNYEDVILYPVRYTNIPENKVLLNELPDKLSLRVKANGRKILLSKLNLNLIPIKFDVNSFITGNSSPDSLFILTNSIKDILASELEGVEIIKIEPDTLFFRFTTMEVRKVIVKAKYNDAVLMVAPQYMINGAIVIEPDSIIISGPGSILKKISCIFTEPLNVNNLSDTVTRICILEKQPGVTYSQKKVRIIIPVDKYTQAERFLPVVAANLPDSLSIKTFPERIKISYNVTLSNYEKIDTERIMPHVNYNDILHNPTIKLRVYLVDTPDQIDAIKFSPEKVEYLLTRQ